MNWRNVLLKLLQSQKLCCGYEGGCKGELPNNCDTIIINKLDEPNILLLRGINFYLKKEMIFGEITGQGVSLGNNGGDLITIPKRGNVLWHRTWCTEQFTALGNASGLVDKIQLLWEKEKIICQGEYVISNNYKNSEEIGTK